MEFSSQLKEFIKKELVRYEVKRSAIIPCLFAVQKEQGWVSPEAITVLSKEMELPETWITEVTSFYTMFNRKPVGKYHVQVCCNISCSMAGGRELAAHLEKNLSAKAGEVSPDGRYTVSRVECLGACGTAPMMQVNDEYYENLTLESAEKLLREME
ncbi:MAG: NADH-quinone oxidoreductase subunit NuoE [Bdellovibrionales bacterium]|nr:NADH-quinone oxidoreductase subunit NuoE [Bdellovibrionales bacterium]